MNTALNALVTAPPWFLGLVATLLGASVGSFLNVVILRVPVGKSVVRPGSHCACGAPIAWHDNIPILGWLMLRGRARCCGRPVSVRYAFVEALTAALFLAAWLRLGSPLETLCAWIFLSSLVCATFIDLDHLVIPDVFTIGLGIAGVLLSGFVPALHGEHSGLSIVDDMRSGADAIIGLTVGSGFVLWIALVAEAILGKEAMGFGDVKLVGAIGAFCGWHGAVFSVFGGAGVGSIWFAAALVLRRLRPSAAPILRTESPEGQPTAPAAGAHVPFGPMLAIAAALYLLVLRAPVDAWFSDLESLFRAGPSLQ